LQIVSIILQNGGTEHFCSVPLKGGMNIVGKLRFLFTSDHNCRNDCADNDHRASNAQTDDKSRIVLFFFGLIGFFVGLFVRFFIRNKIACYFKVVGIIKLDSSNVVSVCIVPIQT